MGWRGPGMRIGASGAILFFLHFIYFLFLFFTHEEGWGPISFRQVTAFDHVCALSSVLDCKMSAETKEAFCGLHPKMTIGIFSSIVNQSVSMCVCVIVVNRPSSHWCWLIIWLVFRLWTASIAPQRQSEPLFRWCGSSPSGRNDCLIYLWSRLRLDRVKLNNWAWRGKPFFCTGWVTRWAEEVCSDKQSHQN